MTEVEWITTKLPLYMLREYPSKWDVRKARLCACACLRGAVDIVREKRTWRLIEAVEQYPENEKELFPAMEKILADFAGFTPEGLDQFHDYFALAGLAAQTLPDTLIDLLRTVTYRVAMGAEPRTESEVSFALRLRAEAPEKARQADLLREVFGNPFRPVDFAPWRTDTAVSLARQMYESREFSAMPVLADALQDAGCDNVNVLDHCRQPGEHVRGCWVIDALLGKG